MKIELEIPQDVVDHCRKLNIADVNIPIVYKDFCYDRLGYFVALTSNEFKHWAEDDDNTCNYIEKTKKALVEVKMVIEVTMDKNNSVDDAIAEMSENISSSDLISSKGCIVGGRVEEYIIKKLQ